MPTSSALRQFAEEPAAWGELAPDSGYTRIEVRRADDADDLALAASIAAAAFGREYGPPGTYVRVYLASLDGRAVGSAKAHLEPGTPGALLVGGAVLPGARGRGAYRALVRARWDDAVAEGFGGVCVQAGAMSRPILERLGFERVAEHELLGDPATC